MLLIHIWAELPCEFNKTNIEHEQRSMLPDLKEMYSQKAEIAIDRTI